jgi:hypothetical protein
LSRGSSTGRSGCCDACAVQVDHVGAAAHLATGSASTLGVARGIRVERQSGQSAGVSTNTGASAVRSRKRVSFALAGRGTEVSRHERRRVLVTVEAAVVAEASVRTSLRIRGGDDACGVVNVQDRTGATGFVGCAAARHVARESRQDSGRVQVVATVASATMMSVSVPRPK